MSGSGRLVPLDIFRLVMYKVYTEFISVSIQYQSAILNLGPAL